MSEKSETPTPRRLRKAREEGDVAVSAELSGAVSFLAAVALAPAAVAATVAGAGALVLAALSVGTVAEATAFSAEHVAWPVLLLSLPLLLAAGGASLAVGLVQSGGAFAPARLAPRLERLNVIAGLGSLFQPQRLFAVVRALFAATVVAWLAYRIVRPALASLANTSGELAAALGLATEAAQRLAFQAGLLGVALGVVDLLFVRHAWLDRLRMTKDEVRREFRESEGDPELKAARRRAHREVLVQAALHAVEKASVVIVNPTELATALRYDEEAGEAPEILAQGQGEIARRIVERARAAGVPVVRDVPVARALQELEVGDQIPEALYEAVAAILREAWEAEQKA